MNIQVQANEWGGGWERLAAGVYLSPLQKRLLQMEGAGKTVAEIAEESRLSVRAVQIQLAQIRGLTASAARKPGLLNQ